MAVTCTDVRSRIGSCLRDLLMPTLGKDDIVELDDACWTRATALAFSPGDVDRLYVQACRDVVANICQSNLSNGNTWLCDSIRTHRVSTCHIPSMTASELRPGVHRPAPSRCCDDGSDAARATNLFECPRCSERKCTHYELQTRSADEATTVFVSCVACGHRWTE